MNNNDNYCIVCKCPLCENISRPEIDSLEIKCARCGDYIIVRSFEPALRNDNIFVTTQVHKQLFHKNTSIPYTAA
jgi:hypothetical protein